MTQLLPNQSDSGHWDDEIEAESEYLIRHTDSYAIYIDKDCDLEWITSKEHDKQGQSDPSKHNAILSDAAVLECTPCHGLSLEKKRHFKRLLGEALACNFEDDYPNAQQMLSEARNYIKARSEETSRRWYLSASALTAALSIAAGFAIWLCRDLLTPLLTRDGLWLCLAAVAGSCGALLSVIWRSGQLKFDCSAGQALHYLEGSSRIWAGALSGIVLALAVKSEFILAPLTRTGKAATITMLAAFAAGAAERFATSIISKFETNEASPTGKQTDREQSL